MVISIRLLRVLKQNFSSLLRMQLRPLHDRLIVKPVSKEEVTALGIIIPDTAGEKRPEQGEVIAIGPGKLRDDGSRSALSVKVGDKIVFKKYAPDEVKIGDETYLVLAESDVMAVIEA